MLRSSLIWISVLTLGLAGACGDDAGDTSTIAAATGGSDAAGQTPDGGGPGGADAGDPGADAGGTGGIDAAPNPADPLLVEVFYDKAGGGPNGDDTFQWVKLYNPSDAPMGLSGYSLGWAGTDYTAGTLQLSGTIEAGGCFVVGGPTSAGENGNPTYGLSVDLAPNLDRGVDAAGGVALFDVTADLIDATTVPIDAVIYATGSVENSNGLLDETGAAGAIDVTGAGENESIRRLDSGTTWDPNPTPTPDKCPPFDQVSI